MAKKQNRDQRLRLYYTCDEYERLEQLAERSMHKTVSGYVRKVSLQQPVEIVMRNVSFDRLIDEIIVLRKEMEAVRLLPELGVSGLERLIRIGEEIRNTINQIAELCTPK